MTDIDLSYNQITDTTGGFWSLDGVGGWQRCSFPLLQNINFSHNNITWIGQSVNSSLYSYDALNT